MSDLFSLEGRVAIVTGGAGQIGSEIARGLEQRGARVAVFDLEGGEFRVDVTDRSAIDHFAFRDEIHFRLGLSVKALDCCGTNSGTCKH